MQGIVSSKVLGIIGLDYSGSTLLTNILSGLPDTVNTGESHWIIDRNLGCKECGNQPCPIYTQEMMNELRELSIPTTEWWNVIASHSNSKLIISSDKRPRHYDRLGHPNHVILLIKDPRANITSWCSRKFNDAKREDEFFTNEQVERGLVWWYKLHKEAIDWLEENEIPTTVLFLEDFVSNQRERLSSIAEIFSMSLNDEQKTNALQFWERQLHYIGGNHSVKRLDKNRYFYKSIKIDERWKNRLSDESQHEILVDRRVSIVNKRIQQFRILGPDISQK
ncbi:MAG: hypothetical protein CMB57_05760 [Euryarchaeota archaeon]|nr:hypothetical protein [Euryarchaeota archaeon]